MTRIGDGRTLADGGSGHHRHVCLLQDVLTRCGLRTGRKKASGVRRRLGRWLHCVVASAQSVGDEVRGWRRLGFATTNGDGLNQGQAVPLAGQNSLGVGDLRVG